MKKVIYSLIVLIGIAAIASNFIINRDKLDHKQVSASGTACRWISDTGYGTGPIYYSCTDTTEDSMFECVSIFKCDTSIEGEVLQSGVVYDSNRKLLNGIKRTDKVANGNTANYTFSDGVVTKYRALGVGASTTVQYQYILIPQYSFEDQNNYYETFGSSRHANNLSKDLLPSQYTCVCAEY